MNFHNFYEINDMIQQDSVKAIVSPTQIQYTLISPVNKHEHSDFQTAALGLLRSLPIDLLQLENAANYYYSSFCSVRNSGIDLYQLDSGLFVGSRERNIRIFNEYSNIFNVDYIKVFLVDGTIKNHKEIAEMIEDVKFGYYIMINDPGEKNAAYYNQQNFFGNSDELIALIRRDLNDINVLIEGDYGFKIDDFDFKINKDADSLNPMYPTTYAYSNFFILNQILANDWDSRHKRPEKDDFFKDNNKRATIQLKQVNVIDGLSRVVRTENPASVIEPIYPSMILIAPFHFPKYEQLMPKPFATKKEKMLLEVLQTEQKSDYSYKINEDFVKELGVEVIGKTLSITAAKLQMLDFAGYLHAQFRFSPIFRMPIVGRTINSELAGLENALSAKKKGLKKIDAIGELMKHNMMTPELKEYLIERNGQIVFISDLPMEWLKMNKYPIFLTHDVCRIPEFNFNSLLNNYIHNQRLNFQIAPNILERTLVIHCASDNDYNMQHHFSAIESMQVSLGFKSVRCNTVESIREAVVNYKPDLLIFDCHGSFDRKELSSYLVIDAQNNIRLTGDQIIEYGISAPLVFISACSTMPSNGYIKFISDAFLQAGAFSVTATFLPIRMQDATILVSRILTNLKQQETKIIFSNWLAFISHNLRSTLVFETVRKIRSEHGLDEEVDDEKVSEILLHLMIFDSREEAFDILGEYLKSIVPDADVLFENLKHEWLCYTTIGRADLITFQQWSDKHRENYKLLSSN